MSARALPGRVVFTARCRAFVRCMSTCCPLICSRIMARSRSRSRPRAGDATHGPAPFKRMPKRPLPPAAAAGKQKAMPRPKPSADLPGPAAACTVLPRPPMCAASSGAPKAPTTLRPLPPPPRPVPPLPRPVPPPPRPVPPPRPPQPPHRPLPEPLPRATDDVRSRRPLPRPLPKPLRRIDAPAGAVVLLPHEAGDVPAWPKGSIQAFVYPPWRWRDYSAYELSVLALSKAPSDSGHLHSLSSKARGSDVGRFQAPSGGSASSS